MTAHAAIDRAGPAPFDVFDDWNGGVSGGGSAQEAPRASRLRARDWRGTAMQIAVTLAVAVSSYALSLNVTAERSAVAKIASQNRMLAGDIRALDAELRVRMRLPQLQRWNDEVLGLMPVSAAQFVGDAAALGGTEPAGALPTPQFAIAQLPAAAPRMVLAAVPAPQRPAGLMLASTGAPAPVAAAPAPVRMAAPTEAPVRAAPAKPRAEKIVAAEAPKPVAKPKPAAPKLDAIGSLIADAADDEQRGAASPAAGAADQ